MPIVHIQLVGQPPSNISTGLAQRLADIIGKVLGSRPRGTWVKIQILDPHLYAENAETDTEIRPVFVSILKRNVPSGDRLKREIKALTQAIAHACERPEDNIHILYEPAGAGRIAFGGVLVE